MPDLATFSPALRLTAKIGLLTVLYIASGKVGLMLAVPPGYATIIWPASGIAMGMLIVHGWRLWPGVLIGSFILNALMSDAASFESDAAMTTIMTAAGIAVGSTMQALLGRWLVARLIGLPLTLNHAGKLLMLLAVTGPLACLIAPTFGVTSLFVADVLSVDRIAGNWLTWWAGDVFGVLVFLPLMLVAPGASTPLTWGTHKIGALPVFAVLILLVSLGLSFYAWKVSAEIVHKEATRQFQALVDEGERALVSRLESYNYALLGAVGFFQGSDAVLRDEWQRYMNVINVKKNFPGIGGIGVIVPVSAQALPEFLKKMRADVADFSVHPKTQGKPFYIIQYVEPREENKAALGLNIAFENTRRQAAELARDRGIQAITKRISLVQSAGKPPGFLMFYPIYKNGMPVNTPQERRAAFVGWVYAPFIASNFLRDLTHAQDKNLHLEVYDDSMPSAKSLIYEDEDTKNGTPHRQPYFVTRTEHQMMQNTWTLVWKSTRAFEVQNRSNAPLLVLAGGLLFTGLLALFLIVTTLKSADALEIIAGRQAVLLPAIVFFVALGGALLLYNNLKAREQGYLREVLQGQADNIKELLKVQVSDQMLALQRMAQRWETSGGTQENEWRADARNHLAQLAGLKALEWVGADYRVRWVEPEKGNTAALGLNIAFDAQRQQALEGAEKKRQLTLTPPIDLVQGYRGMIVYAPIHIGDTFDGFIAGILSAKEFFDKAVSADVLANYSIVLSVDGKELFSNAVNPDDVEPAFTRETSLALYNKSVTVRLVPRKHFIDTFRTEIPAVVLFSGGVIALLLALTMRYMLISHIKAGHLERSSKLNQGILSSSSYLMVATDKSGTIVVFNEAAERALGYRASEIVGHKTPEIWQDHDEVAARAQELTRELGRPVITGLDVFVAKPIMDGQETREWTFIAKNGRRFPVALTVTTLRDNRGAITGYLGIAEDISTRREVDQMKAEFISIISHELRTPLTSIRASLGLIEGTMFAELPAKVRALIDIAHKNSQRLIILINDILDLDKITAGKMRLSPGVENVADLVNAGLELNQSYADKFSVAFVGGDIPVDLMVYVDADRWQQVFSNLLSNAAKFSPPHSLVHVAVLCRDKQVRVAVRDDGPGVAVEFHSRIFSKFSQSDAALTRSQGGTGLGLNISKELVERMGGVIGFDSVPGQGATFWFDFPLWDGTEAPPAHENEVQREPQAAARPLRCVLCIDDDPSILELITLCLRNVGKLTVTGCHSGAEGVARAGAEKPDMILVDMMMPDMDGFATLRKLRENPRLVDTPVVFMTARVQPAEVEAYIAQGAAAVIAKPFDPMQISDQVREIWESLQEKEKT